MEEYQIGSIIIDAGIWQAIYAAGIFLVFIIFAIVAHLMLKKVVRRLTAEWSNQPSGELIHALSRPVSAIILTHGIFLATLPLDILDPWSESIKTFWVTVNIIFLAQILARSGNEILLWYGRFVAPLKQNDVTSKLVPAVRRVFSLAIYGIATMLILDQFNVSITPLIAGFGIGGVAVALALQPTLSNFFAGTYLVSGEAIKQGDYVELENGLRGYVVEVGWRNTRLKTDFNNLVIIPNSRLADSILTNYYGPAMEIGVIVEAGVSYSSDLGQVEMITLEVANQVIEEVPGAKKPYKPWFGFSQFGESNIDFWVWLEATDRLASFAVKSELIKRLHKRFGEEGIDINYPMRQLLFPDRDSFPLSGLN
ncbi:mechanosensitive ion channel family protein [SAR202 cluster bacterium AD-802-E10_MRT_200m]|nr:mechanosensitive ion channel family protein [SAR202 cluster bacterium AD-802-E10_MRT_200m]